MHSASYFAGAAYGDYLLLEEVKDAEEPFRITYGYILHAALDETFCCACVRLGNK
jgi:hypothetical protein